VVLQFTRWMSMIPAQAEGKSSIDIQISTHPQAFRFAVSLSRQGSTSLVPLFSSDPARLSPTLGSPLTSWHPQPPSAMLAAMWPAY
jgi:hypothetical protein